MPTIEENKKTDNTESEANSTNSDEACFPAIPSVTVNGVQVCPICGEPID